MCIHCSCVCMDQLLKTMMDYRLESLGFSEMRWTGQGLLVIDGATVLYSGKQDQHTHGVGIILSSCVTQTLVGWKPVNDRIITVEVASEEDKDAFYSQSPSYDIKMLIPQWDHMGLQAPQMSTGRDC